MRNDKWLAVDNVSIQHQMPSSWRNWSVGTWYCLHFIQFVRFTWIYQVFRSMTLSTFSHIATERARDRLLWRLNPWIHDFSICRSEEYHIRTIWNDFVQEALMDGNMFDELNKYFLLAFVMSVSLWDSNYSKARKRNRLRLKHEKIATAQQKKQSFYLFESCHKIG